MDVLPGPGDIVSIRASSLPEIFDDSLRWKSKYIDNIKSATFGRSHLGTSIHAGTALFDTQRMLGEDTPDPEEAVQTFMDVLHDDENIVWEDITKSDAQIVGTRLVADYCQDVSPEFDFVAVESRCDPMEIDMPNGMILEITGQNDRVYEVDEKYGIIDLKSGYRVVMSDGAVDTGSHGAQLAVYELLETMATVTTGHPITLPAIIIGLSTSTGAIVSQEVKNPRTLLFGDGHHMGYLIAASEIIARQLYVGNPKSMLCTARYCPIFNNCFYRRGSK